MTAKAPWLQDAISRAEALLARLPHGLLVDGPGGWGEAQVADALAVRLLALDGDRPASEVAHPDLRWLEPVDGTIRIDAIRAAIDFLQQTPRLADRKAAVIVDAERMNLSAANALLKSLEEPPAESFLVLVSGAPERLLPTVRSRCQRLSVHAAPRAQVMAWLAAEGVEGETAAQLVAEYGGAPFAVREAAAAGATPLWPELVAAGRGAAAASLAESRKAEDLAELAGRWLRIVHGLARQRLESGGTGLESLIGFAAELERTREAALFNKGLNRSLQLERLLLLWAELWREQPLVRR
jgi:DNA polymerase-3 subunit delta'